MQQIIAILTIVLGALLLSFCSPAPTDEVGVNPSAVIIITPTNKQIAENTAKPARKTTTPDSVMANLANASTILPEGVLEEIRFYGGGGGGEEPGAFHYCQNEKTPKLTLGVSEMTDVELSLLYDSSIFVTCGWHANEQVTITVTAQDGSRHVENVTAYPESWDPDKPVFGYIVAVSPETFGFAVGNYKIRFEGESGTINASLDVFPTESERADYDNGGIFLSNFSPNDLAYIVYYPRGQHPISQSYQIGQSGTLLIKEIPWEIETYAILSRQSGYITTLSFGSLGVTSPIKCRNALPTKIGPRGILGQWLPLAPFLQDTGLKLYSRPDYDAPVTARFSYESPHGPYVRILSEPVCGENATWWKILTSENQIGWAVESDEHSYYFVGSVYLGVSTNYGWPDCYSELVVGEAVRVTFTVGTPLNLREAPNLSANIVDKIPEGTRLIIKDGPNCDADPGVWWKIEMSNGTSGWVVENTRQANYLEAWK